MAEQLRLPDWLDLINCFEFANNQIIHEHIKSQSFGELDSIVNDRNIELSAERQLPLCEFMAEANLIDLF